MDLSGESQAASVPTIPPADIHVCELERDTNTQGTSFESFTAMLNNGSSSLACSDESTGGSFIQVAVHAKLHILKLSVPVGPFPDMPVDYDHHDDC